MNNIDTNSNNTNKPLAPVQQPELSVQVCAQIPKKSPIKQTAISTIFIGFALFIYGLLLIQSAGYSQPLMYFVAGIIFIVTGSILIKNQRYGKILFSIITWSSIALSIVIIMNPFSVLSLFALLLNMSPVILCQIGFVIGLNIYMQSTNKMLSRYVKQNNEAAQLSDTMKRSKLPFFGLLIIFISIVTILCSSCISLIDQSFGKTKGYESYLENKYNEKFELSGFKTTTQYETSFTTCDKLTAKAHPVNNNAITFEISSYIRNCKDYDKYSDDYANKFWEYEKRPEIDNELKKVYGKIPEYEMTIELESDMMGHSTDPKLPNGILPSIDTIIAGNYKPILLLTTYLDDVLTKDNVGVSEARTRTMSSYIINNLGFINFNFKYIMKDPKSPSPDEYTGFEVKQSDIHCQDIFSIDGDNYQQMTYSDNLEEFYSKTCNDKNGGGVATGTYPK